MVYLVVFALVVMAAVLWLIFIIAHGIFRLLSSAIDFLGTEKPKKDRPSAPALSPGIYVRWTPARRYEAARDLADWQIRFDATLAGVSTDLSHGRRNNERSRDPNLAYMDHLAQPRKARVR